MKKFKCTVTITKQIELRIPDELLTAEQIKDFESAMYNVGGDEKGIAKHIASTVAQHGDFVEGIGLIMQVHRNSNSQQLSYYENFHDVEVSVKEIVKNDN